MTETEKTLEDRIKEKQREASLKFIEALFCMSGDVQSLTMNLMLDRISLCNELLTPNK